jgi:hypothetical protein
MELTQQGRCCSKVGLAAAAGVQLVGSTTFAEAAFEVAHRQAVNHSLQAYLTVSRTSRRVAKAETPVGIAATPVAAAANVKGKVAVEGMCAHFADVAGTAVAVAAETRNKHTSGAAAASRPAVIVDISVVSRLGRCSDGGSRPHLRASFSRSCSCGSDV